MDQTTIFVPEKLFAPAESSSYAGTLDLGQLSAGPDVYAFASPVSWSVTVTNTGGAFLVAGTAKGSATTQCARCLEDVLLDLAGDIEGYFLIEGHEEELDEDDQAEFEALGPNNSIDLVPLIQAAILVDLPLLPLCRQDCKGICPDCGINLNQESCDCAQARAKADADFEAAKNPFAKLAELDLTQPSGQ